MAFTFSSGTVAATNGEKAIVFSSTVAISTNMKPGDLIYIGDAPPNTIESLDGEPDYNGAQLGVDFAGTSGDELSYFIVHMPTGWGDRIALNAHVAENIRLLTGGQVTLEQLTTLLEEVESFVTTITETSALVEASAEAAATSETNAAASEANAASAETTVIAAAESILGTEAAVAALASAAASSETNAAASAVAAASSETNAATSETNAATSETNAAASEAAAATSETNAATSEANAETAASTATTKASEAQSHAADALAAATRLQGTSTSSVTIGTGTKTFTTQAGKDFDVGRDLKIVSTADPNTDFMAGTVTDYDDETGELEIYVVRVGGSGTIDDWKIYITGLVGEQGPSGASDFGDLTNTPTTAAGYGITDVRKTLSGATTLYWNSEGSDDSDGLSPLQPIKSSSVLDAALHKIDYNGKSLQVRAYGPTTPVLDINGPFTGLTTPDNLVIRGTPLENFDDVTFTPGDHEDFSIVDDDGVYPVTSPTVAVRVRNGARLTFYNLGIRDCFMGFQVQGKGSFAKIGAVRFGNFNRGYRIGGASYNVASMESALISAIDGGMFERVGGFTVAGDVDTILNLQHHSYGMATSGGEIIFDGSDNPDGVLDIRAYHLLRGLCLLRYVASGTYPTTYSIEEGTTFAGSGMYKAWLDEGAQIGMAGGEYDTFPGALGIKELQFGRFWTGVEEYPKTAVFSRDMAAETGVVSYTLGFRPRALIFAAAEGTVASRASWGFAGSPLSGNSFNLRYTNAFTADTFSISNPASNQVIFLGHTSAGQTATLYSFDDEGFSLNWGKMGTATSASASFGVIAFP